MPDWRKEPSSAPAPFVLRSYSRELPEQGMRLAERTAERVQAQPSFT